MFNCLCINDLFALQRYKNFWTFLLFSLCFKALSTIYMQVGNFSKIGFSMNLVAWENSCSRPVAGDCVLMLGVDLTKWYTQKYNQYKTASLLKHTNRVKSYLK